MAGHGPTAWRTPQSSQRSGTTWVWTSMTGFGLTPGRPLLPGGRCDLHAAEACGVDGALNDAGALRVPDPVADVAERGRAAFGQRESELHDVEPVGEDARAWQPIRQSEEHEAILRVRVGLSLSEQLEGRRLALDRGELGILDRALEHEGGRRAARRGHADARPIGVGDAGDRRAGTHEIRDVDDDVGWRIVDDGAPRGIDAEDGDVPGASLRIVHQAGDRRVLERHEADARVVGQLLAQRERRARELAGRAVLGGDDGIAGEERDAEHAARRELALDGRARLGEPARTTAHEREPDDSRDCPRRPHRHGYGLKMSTPTSTTLLEPLFSAQ